MTSMCTSSFYTDILGFVESMQTEILLFVLAFFLQAAVFGKHRIPKASRVNSRPGAKQCKQGPDHKSPSSAHCSASPSPPAIEQAPLLSDVQLRVRSLAPSQAVDTLAETIKNAGGSASTDLLSFARGFLQEHNIQPDSKLGASLLCGYANLGMQREFREVLKDMGMEGRQSEVAALLEQRASHQNALLGAVLEARGLSHAERAFSRAIEHGLADAASFNIMIKAYHNAGRPEQAHAAVKSMREAGLRPNIFTFNTTLDATVKNSPADRWTVLEQMRQEGMKPSNATCSILLKGIQKTSSSGDMQRTLEVVNSTEDELNETVICSILEACIRSGRLEMLAQQLARHRTEQKVEIRSAPAYGSMIRAYGLLRNISGVWETWGEMNLRQIQPTSITLGCMVEAVVINGDPDAAHELIRERLGSSESRHLVNAIMYCSVLKGYSHARRFQCAWSLYEEMLAEGVDLTVTTYNALVDACARCGQMCRVPGLLEKLTGQGIQPNVVTYSTIIKGYCQENRLDKAFELKRAMQETREFNSDEVTYNVLLDGCARQGLYDRGMALLEEMEELGVRPSNYTLSVLVKLANRSHRLPEGFKMCETISAKYKFQLNTPVYNNLMQACIAHRNSQLALQTFEKMLNQRVRPDRRSYAVILRGFVEIGDAQTAAALIRAATGLDSFPAGATTSCSSAKVQDGLPTELISEILEGIAQTCGDEYLAMDLLRELKRHRVQLDPRLFTRLTRHGSTGRGVNAH